MPTQLITTSGSFDRLGELIRRCHVYSRDRLIFIKDPKPLDGIKFPSDRRERLEVATQGLDQLMAQHSITAEDQNTHNLMIRSDKKMNTLVGIGLIRLPGKAEFFDDWNDLFGTPSITFVDLHY